MAETTYPCGKVIDPDRLTLELRQTSIVPNFYITGLGTSFSVVYKAELSESELVIFNNVVAAHVPTPLNPEEETLKATDRRLIVKENKRPIGSNGFCTSRGENPLSPLTIGAGDPVRFFHTVGDTPTLNYTKEVFFHVAVNRSWLWDGYLNYQNAVFNEFTFQIRPYVTTILTGQTGTNYNTYGGYLLIPAAGNGTKDLDPNAPLYPCSVVPKTDTGFCPAAYWNMDYSSSTNTYGNLTPASNPNATGATGNGKYNIFTADVCLKEYIHKWGLLGSYLEQFVSSDPSEYGTFLRSIFKFTTIGQPDPTQSVVDHAWSALVNFTMFREKIA